MRCARIFWVCLLGTVTLAGCGGKVVVDLPSGEGGGGGVGGAGPGPVGPSSNASVGPGPSVSSASGGQFCDGQSNCEACADCALGSPCADIWNKCLSVPDCAQLSDCVGTCPDQQCVEKCSAAFPGGVDIYNEAAFCVVCQACFFDCEGPTKGCPP